MSAAAAFGGVAVKVKHVGLVLSFSSHHVRHEYNENRKTSRMQHQCPFICCLYIHRPFVLAR